MKCAYKILSAISSSGMFDEIKERESLLLCCHLRDYVSHSGTGMETIFLLTAQEEFWLMPSFPELTERETFTLTMMRLGQWATVWVSEGPGSFGMTFYL